MRNDYARSRLCPIPTQKTPSEEGVMHRAKPVGGFQRESDQPIAGAIRATGVASAAARSSGKL
jgi:hypothetical protein